ncbi:uncharacterized protein PV09_07297 [Verruconis gallopava]|uniref:Uncharacterized protein n=1 Tax=Verruconis gallopava TaxID=253628 RepID=A0A0D2A457_9PEZI|nr:uncharacterized protein PV09_07297 [Verruconis gallopava]KIW01255.1 hypothetical protein PV09_07297 [Verruconis gallopava]
MHASGNMQLSLGPSSLLENDMSAKRPGRIANHRLHHQSGRDPLEYSCSGIATRPPVCNHGQVLRCLVQLPQIYRFSIVLYYHATGKMHHELSQVLISDMMKHS